MSAVDALAAMEGLVSQEVADDLCDAVDAFLGVATEEDLSRACSEGFLKSPFNDGRELTGRAARVFDPYRETELSERSPLSGMGDLERAGMAGGGILEVEDRSVLPPAGAPARIEGVLRDWILCLLLRGVSLIVDRGFLYALIEARKFGAPSSAPELELGRLLVLDGGRLDPSDWWLDPGRELGRDARLPGREFDLLLTDPVS